jgi:hypothetical protein
MSDPSTLAYPLALSLAVCAHIPPADSALEQIKCDSVRTLRDKLVKLKYTPEKLIEAKATLAPASENIAYRYPVKNLWLLEIVILEEMRFWALVSIDGRGAHFLEYPLTREDVAISLF